LAKEAVSRMSLYWRAVSSYTRRGLAIIHRRAAGYEYKTLSLATSNLCKLVPVQTCSFPFFVSI